MARNTSSVFYHGSKSKSPSNSAAALQSDIDFFLDSPRAIAHDDESKANGKLHYNCANCATGLHGVRGGMTDINSLLHLGSRANQLASQLNASSEPQRLAGRLARDSDDVDALSLSVVYQAKSGDLLAEILKTGTGLVLLHLAIAQISYTLWEDLWNDAHPDRFGQSWDGEDFELMATWREIVFTIIEECHQEWMLTVNADEYVERLKKASADKEVAEGLADWLGNVRGGADECD